MSLVVNCELHWNGSTLHCLAHLKAGTKHQYMISALSSLHWSLMSDPPHSHMLLFTSVKQSSVSKPRFLIFRPTGILYTLIFLSCVTFMTHNVFRWVPIKGNDWYWIRHHIKPGMKVYVEILVNNLHSSRMFQRCLLALYRNSGYSSLVAKKKREDISVAPFHLPKRNFGIFLFSFLLRAICVTYVLEVYASW